MPSPLQCCLRETFQSCAWRGLAPWAWMVSEAHGAASPATEAPWELVRATSLCLTSRYLLCGLLPTVACHPPRSPLHCPQAHEEQEDIQNKGQKARPF